jgi:hypothetical protein
MGHDSVGTLAKVWFNYKSPKVEDHNKKTARIGIMEWYPPFVTIANLTFLICLAGMLLFNGFKDTKSILSKFVLLFISLWLFNMGFSTFASPIALRYQLFPMLTSFTLSIILINTITSLAIEEEHKKTLPTV